jgi:hypothetical protein
LLPLSLEGEGQGEGEAVARNRAGASQFFAALDTPQISAAAKRPRPEQPFQGLLRPNLKKTAEPVRDEIAAALAKPDACGRVKSPGAKN